MTLTMPASRFPHHSPEAGVCLCVQAVFEGGVYLAFPGHPRKTSPISTSADRAWPCAYQQAPCAGQEVSPQSCPRPNPWKLGIRDLMWQQEPCSCDSGCRTPGGR